MAEPTVPPLWWSTNAPDWIITDSFAVELVYRGTWLDTLPADTVRLAPVDTTAQAELERLRAEVKAQAYEITQLTRALDRTRPLRDLEAAVKFYLDDGYDEYDRVTRLHEAVEKLPPALGEAQR